MTLASSQALLPTAAGATAKEKPFKSAPALPSEKAPETKPEVPPGDFRNPPSAAGPLLDEPPKSSFDITKATPVDAETTATEKVYENPDGSHTALVSQRPARFQAEDGSWVDFDLTLAPSADGTLSAKAAPAAATLGAKADGGLATVQTAAGPIVLHHPDAGPVAARTEADHATYAKALGDRRDLVLSPTPDGYKEQVVLADASAGGSYVEGFELPPGMEVREGGAGIEFVDAKGTVVATLAGGVAYDAAFPGAGDSTGVSVHVVPTVVTKAPAIATPPSPTTTSPTTLPATTVPESTLPGAGSPTTTIPADSTTTVVAPSAEPVPTEAADVAVPATDLVSVEISISKDWLGAKGRKGPITIDPTVFTANAYDNFDTYVATSAPTTVLGTSAYIAAGSNDGVNANRGLFYFNTSTIPTGAGVQVVSADLSLYNMYSPSCTARSLNLWGLSTPPTITDQVTWNTQPPLDAATGATTSAVFAKGATGCVAGRVSLDATRLARHWITEAAPNYGIGLLAPNETDASNYRVFYSAQSGTFLAPILTITYNRLPTVATPVAPINGTVLVNDSPSLQVNVATDVDVNLSGQHDVVQYWFRIGTGLNVEGGHGIDSGWFTPGAPGAPACPPGTPAGRVCWSVPTGALSEGVYFWHVFTWDGVTDGSFTVPPNDIDTGKHFLSIKLRLGADGSAPTDTIGPVQVNLASGNATVGHASPRFPTQGGDVGVNVAYNSSARSNGLAGEYYSGTAFPSPSTTPAITRTDPSVAFYWGTDTSPGPGLGVDHYLVRWTGNLTVPAAGSYTFYAATTDGVRVYFNGSSSPAIDSWTDPGGSANRVVTASPMVLAAGAKIPVRVEYQDQSGGATITLGALAPTGPSGAIQNIVLPPSWFTAPAAGPLPTGWTLSAPALSYTSARIFEHGATLTDPTGGLHTYAWTGSGYTPPSDEDGCPRSRRRRPVEPGRN